MIERPVRGGSSAPPQGGSSARAKGGSSAPPLDVKQVRLRRL